MAFMYEYLDGTVSCPPPHIRSAERNFTPNFAFTLWKLIDTQLLSCLTASLSPITLAYILGLHHSHKVWESLSNRYNTLSKSNVFEFKSKLYTITKTSTVENYVDTIKEYAQKLAVAGSPIEDDDLIFHTLRGLPPVFNSFKTMVRTLQQQGHGVTFNEVVTMLHGEDAQLLQESTTAIEPISALVATHSQGKLPVGYASSSLNDPSISSASSSTYNNLNQAFGQLGISSQYGPPQFGPNIYGPPQNPHAQLSGPSSSPAMTQHSIPQQSMPHQFYHQSFRSLNRGRGRGPRLPCEICDKSNHSTNYCYYRPQSTPFFPNVPWRTHAQNSPWMPAQNSSWMPISPPWMHPYQYSSGIPMYQPSFSQPQPPMISSQTSGTTVPSQQPAFAGFTATSSTPQMDQFSGFYTGIGSVPQFAGNRGPQFTFPTPTYPSVASTSNAFSQPWYFDSGATNHITNNLQNLTNPQPATVSDGIMVGNGSQLQVSHTGKGQEYSQSLVQGPMP